MADFLTCFNWTMDFEDPARAYKTVQDACPGGCAGPCYAIAGINSGAWPAQFAAIDSAPYKEDRESMIEAFYHEHYWNKWYEQLASDGVAKRVFDMAVNAGSVAAVRCLQEAANLLAALTACAQVAEDGRWGPATVATANDSTVTSLVGIFQDRRVAHYKAIVAANPSDAKYLDAWIARARK